MTVLWLVGTGISLVVISVMTDADGGFHCEYNSSYEYGYDFTSINRIVSLARFCRNKLLAAAIAVCFSCAAYGLQFALLRLQFKGNMIYNIYAAK